MGRPSGPTVGKRHPAKALRVELQQLIERGQCAYCRAPASPNRPLTREHVIPRARGGRRKDVRIIVPACERCNHHRGSKDLIPFLLGRPQRISSFLDYLASLSTDSIRELDLRVFAELYTAISILGECAAHGDAWRPQLERLCSGRSLYRRRYAARRAVGAISERIESMHLLEPDPVGPTCLVPQARPGSDSLQLEEPLERLAARILMVLALLWRVPAATVKREMARELSGARASRVGSVDSSFPLDADAEEDGIVALDGWKARRKRKRVRVDRRSRATIRQRYPGTSRGRAA